MYQRFFYQILKSRVETPLNFLQVLIGPRQVGKTTTLEQLYNDWQGKKIFESADDIPVSGKEWLTFHWQRAREFSEPCLLILDEVQKIENWSEVIKVLYDQSRKDRLLRVILSGSASLSLHKGLSESLAGRYELTQAPHWGFDEMSGWAQYTKNEYLKFGGYPSSAELRSDAKRWQSFMKNSIVEPVISKDIFSLVNIQKPALFRQLFHLSMLYPAQEISYQKLLGQLQDRGNVATIKHYLEVLEGAFLIKVLEKFSRKGVKTKSSSPKLIPMDSALIHAFTSPQKIDKNPEWKGRVFEAMVGARFAMLPGELYYWREGKNEVDFVYENEGVVTAIEVKSGRKKSDRGLIEFKKRYPETKTLMITWDDFDWVLSLNSEKDFM